MNESRPVLKKNTPGTDTVTVALQCHTTHGDMSWWGAGSSWTPTSPNYVNIQGDNLERVNTFKYLGATLAENGDLDAEMTHRIQSGWKNWKSISGILCDRRISLRVKGNIQDSCKTSNDVDPTVPRRGQ